MVIDNLKNKVRMMDNFIFYGDYHLSRNSGEIVQSIFKDNHDIDCLAIELDEKRFTNLYKKGWLSKFSKLYAEYEKDIYCSALKEAVKIAKEKDIHIELIDKEVEVPLKVRIKYLWFIVGLLFSKKRRDEIKTINLSEVNKELHILDNKKLTQFIQSIKERDKFMVDRITKFYSKYRKIFVIVGYGHLDNIINLLNLKKTVKFNLNKVN